MNFHYDPTWEEGTPTVFMTAQRVWGPLIAGGLMPFTTIILLMLVLIPI